MAVAYADPTLGSSLWNHALGKGQNRSQSFSHKEFAEAMLKCRSMDPEYEYMDADNPDLRKARELGKKVMTGGIKNTQQFHRLFLIPGVGHCTCYRGTAGSLDPPFASLESMFRALVDWVEFEQVPDYLDATSVYHKRSRRIPAYPTTPRFKGGDTNQATNFEP